ncbi:hypothetical protein KR222_005197 [Zaprionus bogoriensis]|nr:hypothetical protein KR222_005197 [Zaprionus bogoriensis]
MTRPKQLQLLLQFQLQFLLQFPLQLLLVLCTLLQLLCCSAALPQDILLDAAQLEQTPSSPGLNVPSDLSAGLNLVPVSSLIAAAANAEPPAPVQFVRIAMNSGL